MCHYLVCLSVCLCVCVTFVVFTGCESWTRPISTNPASMEAGEYGLTRGACFVAGRLEVVTVAALLWISWCVLCGAFFFAFFFVFSIFCLSFNARGLLQAWGRLALFTSLLAICNSSVYRVCNHTLDNRFQVNRQSIGSYSNRRPIVACDGYRLALFEAYYGRQ